MKKYILSMITLSLILTGVTFAQNENSSTTKNKLTREQIQQERADLINRIKEEKASTTAGIKNQIENMAQERVAQQKNSIIKEFGNMMLALNSLVIRTNSRITKIASEGVDMSSSTALLNMAKSKVASAQIEVDALDNLVSQIASTTTPKALKTQIKTQSEKAKTAIKSAKKSISDAISSVARSQAFKKGNSTSTASTTKEN